MSERMWVQLTSPDGDFLVRADRVSTIGPRYVYKDTGKHARCIWVSGDLEYHVIWDESMNLTKLGVDR